MAGQVEAGDLLLHFQQIRGGIFRQVRDLVVVCGFLVLSSAHQAEQVHLAVQILAGVGLDTFQNTLDTLEHTVAGRLQSIECTGFDEVFQRAAVEARAVQPLAEVIETAIGALGTLLNDGFDQVAAHALDSVQAKADPLAVRCEAAARHVDVRLLDLYPQALALRRVLNDLGCVVEHARQQRRHELMRVVAFQIRSLERHVGVAGGVGFVERIRRKADHIVVNFVGNIFRHAVGNTACALLARLLAAVDKVLTLRLHDLELLFTHGAADVISLAEAEAGQLAADLHDLLLIDNNAVRDIDDVRHLRRLIGYMGRVLAVAQIGRNGVHRAGAVERDQCDNVLEVFRAHADKHLRHARGFKLEDTLGLALCQHRVGVGIVIVEVRNAEIRVLAAHGQLGIMDDCQRAQTQKIHFQKTQTLDLHHVELGHGQAVVGGQRHILGSGVTGDDDARRVGGGVARHALDLQRGVDQLMYLIVGVVQRL